MELIHSTNNSSGLEKLISGNINSPYPVLLSTTLPNDPKWARGTPYVLEVPDYLIIAIGSGDLGTPTNKDYPYSIFNWLITKAGLNLEYLHSNIYHEIVIMIINDAEIKLKEKTEKPIVDSSFGFLATSLAWISYTKQLRAIANPNLNYIVIFGPLNNKLLFKKGNEVFCWTNYPRYIIFIPRKGTIEDCLSLSKGTLEEKYIEKTTYNGFHAIRINLLPQGLIVKDLIEYVQNINSLSNRLVELLSKLANYSYKAENENFSKNEAVNLIKEVNKYFPSSDVLGQVTIDTNTRTITI